MAYFWAGLATCWLLCILFVMMVRLRERSVDDRVDRIEFKPTEPVSKAELFAYLLSANFALTENDDFNQLGSSLPAWKVEAMLLSHWGVRTEDDYSCCIEHALHWLGHVTPTERAAYAAWRSGEAIASPTYEALHEIHAFLVGDAAVVDALRIRQVRLGSAAWDIQQTAYLVRLGFSAGHLSRELAHEILSVLVEAARACHRSWEDYSLSALVALGVRSPVDRFDVGDWRQIAKTHCILMQAAQVTLMHAADWDAPQDGHSLSVREDELEVHPA